MRYISIDLSSDNYLEQPQIFGGYAGEHNETVLQVKLPSRMVGTEYSGYRFDFQTSEDNKISSPLIPVSDLNNGVLSFYLTEQLTIAGKLFFNVVATLSNGATVSLTAKTNRVALYIGDSSEGNVQLVDPNGYKDEILKMIDERIVEINPAKVDQTYNPESLNAQSGKAVAEAIASAGGSSDVSGENGATFIPNVSEAGIISWTNDKGLDNPPPVNIKGKDGEDYVLTNADKSDIANLVLANFTDVSEVGV